MMVLTAFAAFSVLRQRFPTVYAGRMQLGDERIHASQRLHNWVKMSLGLSITQVAATSGLDQAMALEFTHFGVRVLSAAGVPVLFLLGPLHMFYGGASAMARVPLEGRLDALAKLSMANVEDRHPWLYWVHSLVVWFVVVLTEVLAYQAQRRFLVRRQAWLKELPGPRATTILVECIPPAYRSDAALREYFDTAMDRPAVASAVIVKKTGFLFGLTRRKDAAVRGLQQARFKMQKTGAIELRDEVDFYAKQRDLLFREIEKERTRVRKEAASVTSKLNTGSGFVTFKSRREADLALKILYSNDEARFAVSAAPDPLDVLYTGFQQGKAVWAMKETCGHMIFAAVALCYLPIVVTIAGMTNLNMLAGMVPFFMPMARSPTLTALWDAVVASVALHLFMSFLPSIAVGVLSRFYRLRAETELQHHLQDIHFRFLMAFAFLIVLFIASVVPVYPQNVDSESTLTALALLASEMPRASHFFLSFLLLQLVSHAHALLRVVPFAKFLAFRVIFDEETAKNLAEPEDQCCDGIGSRSAQMSFVLALCLALGTCCPMMMPVGVANFLTCRLVYGYLIGFAETPKPDSGGRFWATQLKQVHQSLVLYVVLTTAVLAVRHESLWPAAVAATCLVFLYFSWTQFDMRFKSEGLAMDQLLEVDADAAGRFGPLAWSSAEHAAPDAIAALKFERPFAVNSYEQPELSGQGEVHDLDAAASHLGVKLAMMALPWRC